MELCEDELEKQWDERRYRAYVTDALYGMLENFYKAFGGGISMTCRWIEQYDQKSSDKTGDEIAAEVIKRAGLRIGGEA